MTTSTPLSGASRPTIATSRQPSAGWVGPTDSPAGTGTVDTSGSPASRSIRESRSLTPIVAARCRRAVRSRMLDPIPSAIPRMLRDECSRAPRIRWSWTVITAGMAGAAVSTLAESSRAMLW
jgi:hypothetical protein